MWKTEARLLRAVIEPDTLILRGFPNRPEPFVLLNEDDVSFDLISKIGPIKLRVYIFLRLAKVSLTT